MTRTEMTPTEQRARRRCRLAWAGVVGLLFAGAPVGGDLVDCRGLEEVSGYKVLLDDIAVAADEDISSTRMQGAMRRLRSRLQMELEQLQVEAPQGLEVVRCLGRSPAGRTDFGDSLVQVLRRRDVLLEVWGSVLGGAAGSGSGEALVTYLLVPFQDHPDAGRHRFQEAEYSIAFEAPASDLAELFSGRSDLRAFVAIALGVDQLQHDRYDEARAFLCRGQLLLQETHPADDPLVELVASAAASVVESARSDPDYRGLLEAPQIGGCDDDE